MELSPIIWPQALVAKRHSAPIGWLTGGSDRPAARASTAPLCFPGLPLGDAIQVCANAYNNQQLIPYDPVAVQRQVFQVHQVIGLGRSDLLGRAVIDEDRTPSPVRSDSSTLSSR